MYKATSIHPSESRSILQGEEAIRGKGGSLSDILFFKAIIILSIEMERQEGYMSPPYDYEQDNLLTSLLNESAPPKELLNLAESTEFKDYEPLAEESVDAECPSPSFKDLLDKEESNSQLPGNLYQEHGEESLLLLEPAKKAPLEQLATPRKDQKIDKIAYQEETRESKIERYRQKKSRRIWGRKISYDCRKKVADGRERINGRFVKKSPLLMQKGHSHKYSLATDEMEMLKECHESHFSKTDFTNFILQ